MVLGNGNFQERTESFFARRKLNSLLGPLRFQDPTTNRLQRVFFVCRFPDNIQGWKQLLHVRGKDRLEDLYHVLYGLAVVCLGVRINLGAPAADGGEEVRLFFWSHRL